MSRPAVRQYGKQTRRPRAERLFANLPQSPIRRTPRKKLAGDDGVGKLSELVAAVTIEDEGDGKGCGGKRGLRRSTRGETQEGKEPAEVGVMAAAEAESPAKAASKRKSRTKSSKEKAEDPLQGDQETATRDPKIPVEAKSKRRPRTKSAKDAEANETVEKSHDGQETAAEPEAPVEAVGGRNPRTKSSKRAETSKSEDAPQPEPETPAEASVGKRLRTKAARGAETKETPKSSQDEQETATREPEALEAAGQKKLRTKSTEGSGTSTKANSPQDKPPTETTRDPDSAAIQTGLRMLSWDDVCAFPDTITKIAEASYAEVYRVTNARGTSIIKVIRLTSPIKPQTKAQERSGLVDEEPHDVGDLVGELRVSEWVADIPGFVVYKDRYVVRGKAPKALVETHRAFQARAKRADPDRLQFYPSPTRYLDGTSFLVVELGDAGTALEDFPLERAEQVWDVFLLVAIALARAEDLILFEHRDLHEGNLCIRQVSPPRPPDPSQPDLRFGHSGLDITILDYGLSRAEDPYADDVLPVAYDLEKDLGIFTSTHAPQCAVYRQMRSFLLRGDRRCLAPKSHGTPYAVAFDGEPLDWTVFAPYTNVLWLAYTYRYLVEHFAGAKRELAAFRRETREMWGHLDPGAKASVPCFGSAGDVVRFAVESGWVLEGQVVAEGSTLLEREESIVVEDEEGRVRRSPRRREA